MTWQFWGAIIVALISSGVSPAVVPKFLAWKNRKENEEHERQERAEQADEERRERERLTWMRDSEKAYKRLERDWSNCTQTVGGLRRRLNTLLYGLDNLCDESDSGTVKVVDLRAVAHKARMEPEFPTERHGRG